MSTTKSIMHPAPNLSLIEATETAISVEFTPLESVSTYELQWKEYPLTWEHMESQHITIRDNASSKTQRAEAVPLNPGTTYCVRLACDDHAPGPELVVDTEQVGCTPKPKSKGCCVIL